MRYLIIIIFAFVLLVMQGCKEREGRMQPNILFIMVEDLRKGVSRNDNEVPLLPTIDALARQSLVFDCAYMYPDRKMAGEALLTGISPKQKLGSDVSDHRKGSIWTLPDREYTYVEALMDKGYRFLNISKWHLSKNSTAYGGSENNELAKRSILFLDQNENEPLFLSLLYSISDGESEKEQIQEIDTSIGRVVSYLDKKGLRENTVIFFISNNGFFQLKNSAQHYKTSASKVYEGDLRVSSFVNWPGKINARRTNVTISEVDFHPTFLSLANILNKDDGQSGIPMTKLFLKDEKEFTDRLFVNYLLNNEEIGRVCILRKKQYKLIQYIDAYKLELYDVKKDPQEKENLSDAKSELARKLLNELIALQKEIAGNEL